MPHARGGSSSVFVEFLEPVDASFFSGIQSILRIDPAGEKGWVVLVEKEKDPRAIIFKKAVEQGFTIITLHTQEKHLEDVFHDLTTNDNQ